MVTRAKRFEGRMKPLVTQRLPKRFVFFDTETTVPKKDGSTNTFDLILGVMIYVEIDKEANIIYEDKSTFYSIQEFLDLLSILLNKDDTIYMFAHNIGFDIRVLDIPKQFNILGYKSEPPIINEMAFIWKVNTGETKLLFLDTANLGVRSVDSLGKDMNLPKLTIDFDNCTKEELETYCTQDVIILKQFVLSYCQYLHVNQLGAFKVTLASQSMASYRTKFSRELPYIHTNEVSLSMEREGYHGGRVECFRIGTFTGQRFYYLDVNSMYPYCMKGDTLPLRLRGFTQDVSLIFMSPRLSRYYCIADVTIETDEPVYPYFTNGKLIFPTGRFRTVLYHDELQYANKAGHIKYIHKCSVYDCGSLFDDYVSFFYSQKEQHTRENNPTWRTIDKLFLNSLYGKFGQLEPKRDLIGRIKYDAVWRLPLHNVQTGKDYQDICWYGDIYRETKEGETPLSCPAIAGAITSRARMVLWNYISKAGRENVYYCDTDSLITNEQGYLHLKEQLDEYRLGALKLEDTSTELEIYGNKDYRFGSKSKTKGVPSKATVLNKGEWEYLQFEGFITWLNNGASNSPHGKYTIKRRLSNYNKGIVNKDGTITPFNLSVPLVLP